MNEKIVFGQYYHTDSWIHRLDPRTKIIAVFLYMIALFVVKNVYLLGAFLLLALIVITTSKVPLVKFLNSLKMVSFILLFTFFFQLLLRKDGEQLAVFSFNMTIINALLIILLFILYFLSRRIIKSFRVLLLSIVLLISFYIQIKFDFSYLLFTYQVRIFDSGLMMSLYILLRIIALLFISSLLTLTTKPTDLNNGLEAILKPLKHIGVKVSTLTMMISIALRFIPTLINEAEKILKAQASRGVDFKEGKIGAKVMQIISLLVPMFVIAYKRAYDLADAMEARGFIPDAPRTNINLLRYRTSDYLTFGFSFALLVVTIYLRIFYAL
ncbi:MAG: energy-coupling factor transporter transmembrane protein EcfT [Bacilli bacterium]|jgi:energy-coupling factor transport system permease protein|nr:energy-coupling factor transporter transmembrane protein EcfT [Bacilli bacterium]